MPLADSGHVDRDTLGPSRPGDRTVTARSAAGCSPPPARRSRPTSRRRPWGEPAFAWDVDLIHAQLAPIRARRGLASSWAREAFRVYGRSRSRTATMNAARAA